MVYSLFSRLLLLLINIGNLTSLPSLIVVSAVSDVTVVVRRRELEEGRASNEDDFESKRVNQQLLQLRQIKELFSPTSSIMDGTRQPKNEKANDMRHLLEDILSSSSSRNHVPRPGPKRSCGEVIAKVVSKDVIADLIAELIGIFLQHVDATHQSFVTQLFTTPLKYDVQARVVCGSCQDFEMSMRRSEDDTDADPAGTTSDSFQSYCGREKHGYNATHSGLLLLPVVRSSSSPIDKNDGDEVMVHPGHLKAFVGTRGTVISSQLVPSELFPSNLSELLQMTTVGAVAEPGEMQMLLWLTVKEWLGGLIAASSGVIAIHPDFLGYGHSARTHPPSYLVKSLYQQAVGVLWKTVSNQFPNDDDIKDKDPCVTSNSRTVLDNVVTVSGYSEGGYSAFAGALALKALNVTILSANLGAAPLRFVDQFVMTTKQVLLAASQSSRSNKGDTSGAEPSSSPGNPFLSLITSLIAFSYSSSNPDLPNSFTGQNMLDRSWMDPDNFARNVPSWYATNQDEFSIQQLLPAQESFDIFRRGWKELIFATITENTTNPCTFLLLAQQQLEQRQNENYNDGLRQMVRRLVQENDLLCKALLENDLTQQVEATTFPTVLCQSDGDDVVDPETNKPNMMTNPTYLSEYSLPLLGPIPSVDHFTAHFFCTMAFITPYNPSLWIGQPSANSIIDNKKVSLLDGCHQSGESENRVSTTGASPSGDSNNNHNKSSSTMRPPSASSGESIQRGEDAQNHSTSLSFGPIVWFFIMAICMSYLMMTAWRGSGGQDAKRRRRRSGSSRSTSSSSSSPLLLSLREHTPVAASLPQEINLEREHQEDNAPSSNMIVNYDSIP